MAPPLFTGKRRFHRTLFGGLKLQLEVRHPAQRIVVALQGLDEHATLPETTSWWDADMTHGFALDLPDFEPRLV